MPRGVSYLGWSVTVLAAALYLVMLTVTLPHLSALAGGDRMFDLRLLGYGFATAREIVGDLGAAGAAYYAGVQHRLNASFALFAALALIFWQIAAARRWQGYGLPLPSVVLAVILAVAVIANAADLGENAAVSAMLAAGARNLRPSLVDVASTFTTAKTFFWGLSLACLVVLGLGPWVRVLIARIKR